VNRLQSSVTTLAALLSAVLAGTPSVFQSRVIGKIQIRDLVAAPKRYFPVAARVADGFQFIVPEQPAKLLDMGERQSVPNKVEIARGVDVTIVRDKDVDYLYLKDGSQRIGFGDFLTDETLWTHPEFNDTLYQLDRKYFAADAYTIIGLVSSGNSFYTGVYWFSPAASDQHSTLAYVFRVSYSGGKISVKPVRKIDASGSQGHYQGTPFLAQVHGVGSLLVEHSQIWRILPNGIWERYFDMTSVEREYAPYGRLRIMGTWLFYINQGFVPLPNGSRAPTRVVAVDLRTRKPIREFKWDETRTN
jgi:hypothetical protein